jgi:hypothetical protein
MNNITGAELISLRRRVVKSSAAGLADVVFEPLDTCTNGTII